MIRRGLHRNGIIADVRSSSPMVRSYATLFEELCLEAAACSHNGEVQQAPAVAVTATGRGDGCTTVAINIALCAAGLAGYRTLLVDADLERCGASALLGAGKGPGLGEMLTGEAQDGGCAKAVEGTALTLIPAGRGASATIVAQPKRFSELVREWRSRYDWVVIDTPPVLSSAAAVTVARLVSGAAVVLRARRTRPEVLERVTGQLTDAGVPILGAVLNRRRFVIPRGAYRRL